MRIFPKMFSLGFLALGFLLSASSASAAVFSTSHSALSAGDASSAEFSVTISDNPDGLYFVVANGVQALDAFSGTKTGTFVGSFIETYSPGLYDLFVITPGSACRDLPLAAVTSLDCFVGVVGQLNVGSSTNTSPLSLSTTSTWFGNINWSSVASVVGSLFLLVLPSALLLLFVILAVWLVPEFLRRMSR